MTRLARLLPHELDDDQRLVYEAIAGGRRAAGPQVFDLTDDAGGLRGPFNAMLLAPRIGLSLQGLGSTLRYDGVLPARSREAVILLTAWHEGSQFEREAHEAVGRAVGLTELEIFALSAGSIPADLSEDEAAAATIALEILTSGTVGDNRFSATVAEIGSASLYEITTLVGYYRTLAMQMRVFG